MSKVAPTDNPKVALTLYTLYLDLNGSVINVTLLVAWVLILRVSFYLRKYTYTHDWSIDKPIKGDFEKT